MILKLPDTILFSRQDPAGMSILSPWLAMTITVPLRLTWREWSVIMRARHDTHLLSKSNIARD